MEAFEPLQKGYINWHTRYNADFTAVHAELGIKASMEYVQEQIARAPETPGMQEALNKKADQTYVDAELAKKAEVTTLTAHTADAVKHITAAERTSWNGKAEVSQIPASLPANGGNADTTDGFHFLWSDPGGLPAYLIGGDSQSTKVFPPSRLNVNSANTANGAGVGAQGNYTGRYLRNIIQYPNTGISTAPGDVFHVYK